MISILNVLVLVIVKLPRDDENCVELTQDVPRIDISETFQDESQQIEPKKIKNYISFNLYLTYTFKYVRRIPKKMLTIKNTVNI